MNPRRILILTAAHLCRNPRVVKEATTLGAAGHDVTVMTASVLPRFGQADHELARGLPFKRALLDYTANTGRARFAYFLQRGATWMARRLCSGFGLETAQCLGPASALLRRARQFPSDLVIAHTEIPLWAAERLMRDGRRVAVDMEDWYSEDLLPADRRYRPVKLLRRAERFALRHAAYVSAPSASMAAALHQACGGTPPLVLRNSFPLQPHPRGERPAGAVPRFIWFSQTVGPGRGLEFFLDAWALSAAPGEVTLLGDAPADYRQQLLARLPAPRRAGLHFIPAVTPPELPGKLTEFDLGLALEPHEPPNKELTASNKLYQYLNAGLGVIATGTAGQREVMRAAPGCGLLVPSGDTVRFAAQLDGVLANPARLRAMQTAARAAAEREFCWEREAPRLLEAVARALRTPVPSV